MIKQLAVRRIALTFLVSAVTLAFATVAVADTIYLKNGRIIRSSTVRVEDDRVIFVQYSGEVSIPLSMVDRIVEDTTSEPAAVRTMPAPTAGSGQPTESSEPDVSGAAAEPGAEPGETVPADETREFWQEKVGAIVAERAEVELRIEDLKRTERAFLFSHRSTTETRESIAADEARLGELDQEMRDLQSEARRAQVPAGWLRVGAPGSGGGS